MGGVGILQFPEARGGPTEISLALTVSPGIPWWVSLAEPLLISRLAVSGWGESWSGDQHVGQLRQDPRSCQESR